MIHPGALRELTTFMDAHPDVGMVGPKLIRANGQLQPSCRNFPNALTHLCEASGLWKLMRGNYLISNWYYLCSPHDQVREVDWLTGACMVVRPETIAQVGDLNSEMFPIIYGEDMEWCWRMRQAGWKVVFNPKAVITHLENQTPLSDRAVLMYKGFYAFCAHYYPRSKQMSIRVATVLALAPHWLLTRDKKARQVYAALISLPMRATNASRRA
jgi:GT2 family glycosyltransferase